MSRNSVPSPAFLTRRKRKSQIISEDSFCDVPLLDSPHRNTVSFPSAASTPASSSKTSPTKSHPVPSSPSLRKLALLSNYIGCACSSDSLAEVEEPAVKRNSYLAPSFADKQETTDKVDTSPSDTKLSRHFSKIRKTMNRTSIISQSRSQSPCPIEPEEPTNPAHPTPTLPLPFRGSFDTSLGWPDELGIRSETRGTIPHRPWLNGGRTFSESSQRTTWSQPSRPASRQSMRDKSPSRDFLNAQEESLALKTPMTVLETEQSRIGSFTEWTMSSVIFAEAEPSSLQRETSQVRIKEHFENARPPQVNFQTRASDDWAAAVLKAIDEADGI